MNYADIKEKPLLIAIIVAREAHNAGLPSITDENGEKVEHPDAINSDKDYFDYLTNSMLANLAQRLGTDVIEIDAKIVDLQTKRAEIVNKLK